MLRIKPLLLITFTILIIVGAILVSIQKRGSDTAIKIGVITPLTGDSAYWGSSTRKGFELAEKELRNEGLDVKFIFEDGQLDPKTALNAAQKLVTIDSVDAIYSEFNPAAIAVTSFLKDKPIIHLYDAAPVSPLQESDNAYKTYLDYEVNCQSVAEILEHRGIERIGILKMNLEFGELCLKGVKNVFPTAYVENYDVGTTDFRTSLEKLKTKSVQAIVNVAFPQETLIPIRQMSQLGIKVPYVAMTEMFPVPVIEEYKQLLDGVITIGFPPVTEDYKKKFKMTFPGNFIEDEHAAALAYLHGRQLAKALHTCGKKVVCAKEILDNAPADPIIDFRGFHNRVAAFGTEFLEWKDGEFIPIVE